MSIHFVVELGRNMALQLTLLRRAVATGRESPGVVEVGMMSRGSLLLSSASK